MKTQADLADTTIIEADVVDSGIAAEVASEADEVYVLEKNETFGQEISMVNTQ